MPLFAVRGRGSCGQHLQGKRLVLDGQKKAPTHMRTNLKGPASDCRTFSAEHAFEFIDSLNTVRGHHQSPLPSEHLRVVPRLTTFTFKKNFCSTMGSSQRPDPPAPRPRRLGSHSAPTLDLIQPCPNQAHSYRNFQPSSDRSHHRIFTHLMSNVCSTRLPTRRNRR